MITVRARSAAIGLCLVLLASGCSREQQDWRSAEAADTIDSYGQFIQRHPESELVTQARTRVAQLGEDRDWQRAGSADTVDAYRDFISQHPSGKWAQEANIRIQNFSLGEQAGTDAATKAAGAAGSSGGGARVASSGSSADKSAGAGLAVGGPRAAPAVPVGTAGSSGGGVDQRSPPAPAGAGDAARSYGLAQPGEAATAAGSAAHRGPTAAGPTAGGPTAGGGLSGRTGTAAVGTGRAMASGANPEAASGTNPAAGPGPGSGTGSSTGFGASSPGARPAGSAPAPGASSTLASAARPSWNMNSAAISPSGSANTAAPAHVPSAPLPTGATAKGAYGIQLGAFSSESGATAQWRTLTTKYASQLRGLQQHVVPADTASGRIYRLQATVGTEDRARAICVQLRTYGQACVAVLPH